MKSRNSHQCHTLSNSPQRLRHHLLLFFLIVGSLSPALSYKAGHVEPVPGTRKGSSSSPSSTANRNLMIMKLTAPRRQMSYEVNSSNNPGGNPYDHFFLSREMSAPEESNEHVPFVRFPTIPSPFSSHSTEKHHQHNEARLIPTTTITSSNNNNNKGVRQGHHPSKATVSKLLTREEPSSLFTPTRQASSAAVVDEDDLASSAAYYMTGSDTDATASSIDFDRYYSQETDLYEKQSATSSAKPSLASSSSNAEEMGNKGDNNRNKQTNTNDSSFENNATALSKPTLMPTNYLSLAAFHHIDGTLEKSSSSIINRIASFWRSMSKNNTNNANNSNNHVSSNVGSNGANYIYIGSRSSSSSDNNVAVGNNESSSSNSNVVKEEPSSGSKNRSHNTSTDDETETDKVLLKNSNGGGSRRSESLQPSKFISIEDNGSSSGKGYSKQQYLSLDDGEDDDIFASMMHDGGNGEDVKQKDDHQRDHDHHHSDNVEHHHHHGSVEEDASEILSSSSAADLSHTFHDDLFHPATTTGTITAITAEEDFNNLSGDLQSSGSSTRDHVLKSADIKAHHPSVATTGDVQRAEPVDWSINSHFGRDQLVESEEDQEYYGMTIGGFLKRELWTIPLFVLAALNMILIILFEVYVLCRARGQSRRHLFLGQMLLFGLFLCSFLALMFAVHPSIIGCFVGRVGVGVTYSLIFSVLMVKCVFLLSLDTGIYLPTSYQGILLFFSVLVQVAIDTQWVIIFPPYLQTVESGRSILLQCGTSFVQLLYSLSYVGFLVLMVGFLAGRAAYKGVVENYKESVYILIAAVVTVPVALSWTVAGWMLQGRHQDACVSFGLVAHSLTTFLIMFMPKGRQLASLDKEGVCFDDQEDQCSGYSPSFFHFKPTTKNYKTALWGDGNLYTTLEPTVSTINPNVFFHRNDFHSGMIY